MYDELDILDNGTEDVYKSQKRPAFLTVLCILTFVGSGLTMLYSFFMWISFTAAERMFDAFGDMGDVQDESFRMFGWLKFLMLTYLISAVLCVAGAIFMMFMRKIGFYIYIVGQIAPLVVLGVMLGANVQNEFGMAGMVFTAIFPVGFIVMYGLNFKYLR